MPAKIQDPVSHFWSRVDRSIDGGCWLWTGSKNKDGYGSVNFNAESFRESLAHRVAFYLTNGWAPRGGNRRGTRLVRHTCDNRGCCNPTHLVVGTQQQNMDDCRQRGRVYDRRGDRHPRARLTAELVSKIRAGDFAGQSDAEIGVLLGVTRWAIEKARTGANWSSVVPAEHGIKLEIVQ